MTGQCDRLRHALAVILILPALVVLLPPALAGETSISVLSLESRMILVASVLASAAVGFAPAKRRYREWMSVEVDDDDW